MALVAKTKIEAHKTEKRIKAEEKRMVKIEKADAKAAAKQEAKWIKEKEIEEKRVQKLEQAAAREEEKRIKAKEAENRRLEKIERRDAKINAAKTKVAGKSTLVLFYHVHADVQYKGSTT